MAVYPDRGTFWPPPLIHVEPHTIEHGLSVCSHFLASISRYWLLSQVQELCFLLRAATNVHGRKCSGY